MPIVGNKHFPYTPRGVMQAKIHAAKTGKKLVINDHDGDEPKSTKRSKK